VQGGGRFVETPKKVDVQTFINAEQPARKKRGGILSKRGGNWQVKERGEDLASKSDTNDVRVRKEREPRERKVETHPTEVDARSKFQQHAAKAFFSF